MLSKRRTAFMPQLAAINYHCVEILAQMAGSQLFENAFFGFSWFCRGGINLHQLCTGKCLRPQKKVAVSARVFFVYRFHN